MQFKTKTAQERAKKLKSWRPAFAWIPRRVAPDRVVWLEAIEVREVVTGTFPMQNFINQYRLPGSPDFFPEYPRSVTDVEISAALRNREPARIYPEVKDFDPSKHPMNERRKFRNAK